MKRSFPSIETERLLLRQIVPNDLENVFNGLSHPEVIKYYGVNFHSLETTNEQMEWFKNLEKSNSGIWWAICSKDSNEFYGAGGLNDVDKANKKAEIGFWLLPNYWGFGFMKEAMPKICKYGFEQMNLHRIEGFVDSDNTNCKNGMAKLNFKHEGTMTDCEFKNGKFLSLDIYALINN